ncbi:pyruvate ferredoxin oxidoreductase alpha subunit [Natranaerovirga hydrolytica]|uniref:Pyruvate ferredoxin oxidoreductase alpha subunit n=1 Tax=Natranaerovirga hydrolytica TaxID=680378 RepID=A0A4R1MP76_9FIRM|nr:pyruvate ferredoxin oxidoreductase [Natranaerovirga hydrolytica]TCK93114.1 pyruvate ferredoxin oxidoreductase alpha subunit [Natranaerovirga hydrolytica]
MAIRDKLSGNEAVAVAMKQINPDVVAAFPITPSTEIPQYFSNFVSNGEVETEFVPVESEHSAMSACISAAAAGARTMTATSANGLALMWEMLYIAASCKTPVVLTVVNRALSGPINIHNDHSDSMGSRDSGWLQFYGENNQEAYDNLLMALKVAEHPEISLPVMNCYDGFITSHAVENIELIEDDKVKAFVGEYKPSQYMLNSDNQVAVGPLSMPTHYFEQKRQQAESMRKAKDVIIEVSKEFEALTGRKYDLFESYKLDDAEVAVVVLGSTAGTTKHVVDQLRDKGVKAGMLKLRIFRPFPAEEIAEAIKDIKAVAVMDKCDGFNAKGAPVFTEVRSALYDYDTKPAMVNYIYGLGGRDVKTDDIEKVYNDLLEVVKEGKVEDPYRYLGVMEEQ